MCCKGGSLWQTHGKVAILQALVCLIYYFSAAILRRESTRQGYPYLVCSSSNRLCPPKLQKRRVQTDAEHHLQNLHVTLQKLPTAIPSYFMLPIVALSSSLGCHTPHIRVNSHSENGLVHNEEAG